MKYFIKSIVKTVKEISINFIPKYFLSKFLSFDLNLCNEIH